MMMVALKSGVRATADTVGIEGRIRVFQKAIKVIVEPPQKHELQGFTVSTRELFEWK